MVDGGASHGGGDDYGHGGIRDVGVGGNDCYDNADSSKTLSINSSSIKFLLRIYQSRYLGTV